MTSAPSEIFRWLQPWVLSQRVQIKSIKQMKFLSKQTQNRWKFVTAIVRGGYKLWRYISRGVKYLWRNVTRGGGFLPKIVWRHLWTAPNCDCCVRVTNVPSTVLNTIRPFAQWSLILVHLQHSVLNIVYISHSLSNASPVVWLRGCAIERALREIFAQYKIFLKGTLRTT